MPAYNAAPFIAEAIESVLSQNSKAFELIIVDDASKDKTPQILKKYAHLPHVRIVTNHKKLGRGASRNLITKLSRGRYLSPCDADDIMLQGNLKKFSRYLDDHPRVGVVYGDVEMAEFDKRGKKISSRILGRDCNQTWDLFDNAVNHPGSMLRKSMVIKAGGYDERVAYFDDWSLWMRMFEITRFQYLPGKKFYIWRRHAESLRVYSDRDRHDLIRIRLEAIKRRYGGMLHL